MRDVDILEGFFIKDLPERLSAKLAKIGAEINQISTEPLIILEKGAN